ncbi:MAG: helix-turn-helix transcriptional regulator [Desulfovibrionaceae bacterium]|nr:helix-turn-helix transcriptional regulator [Desulfovibrionaceae bacterium]
MIVSNIKTVMEDRKVSVREMAYATGLSTTTILKARRKGITSCRLWTLEIMAEHLQCKVKDLFDEIDEA